MAPGTGGYRQINKALDIRAFEGYLESQQAALPPIPDVERISARVIRILGQNPGTFTFQGTNTYLVGTGAHRILVDTGQGIPDWAVLVADTLRRHNCALRLVLLTHWHGDHTGGVADLLRLYPSLASGIYKHTPSRSQQPIVDGQVFAVEGATVRAIHTPGHAHDHMCFVLEEDRAMFTGDTILGHGTTAIEHLGTWMASLRRMQSAAQLGYPAHGLVLPDLPGKIAAELAQKQRRERRVSLALEQARKQEQAQARPCRGSVTVKQLVAAMHGDDLDEGIRERALEPFTEEVLRKLAEDGNVAFEIRGGVRKWFLVKAVEPVGGGGGGGGE